MVFFKTFTKPIISSSSFVAPINFISKAIVTHGELFADRYAPVPTPESIIDDNWISEMSKEVDALTGLEFDLGDEKTFEFGLDDQYKSQLKNRNARLDEFFDPYVREDGTWDYDLLSSHMAVIDNIDSIHDLGVNIKVNELRDNLVQISHLVNTLLHLEPVLNGDTI